MSWTCSDVRHDPAGLMDLQSRSGLAQIKPQSSRVMLQVKGHQKARSVPCPELQTDRRTFSTGDPRQSKETSRTGKGHRHVYGFGACEADVPLQAVLLKLSKLLKQNCPLQMTNYFFKIVIWLHCWLLHFKSNQITNYFTFKLLSSLHYFSSYQI